jgi:integrase
VHVKAPIEFVAKVEGATINVPQATVENTVNVALRRLGYSNEDMTAHGFRAMASTLLNETGKWHPDAIERQLAHVEGNGVRRAYARGEHWEERLAMMKSWSDYLDQLRSGAKILEGSFRKPPNLSYS